MIDAVPEKLDLPCAWKSEELYEDTSWIWPFSQESLDELDAALQYSKSLGLAEQAVTRDDFPLPNVAKVLDAMLDELEYGRGLVLMRGLPVEKYSPEDLRRLYWGMGTHLGTAESQNIKGELLQEVTDLGFDYNTDAHRGSMSSAQLRAHCDLTDIVGLLCVRPAREGGESTIRSAITIYNEMLETHPEYLPALHRGFQFDLDGKGPTGDPLAVTHVIPVYSWFEGQLSCRFNEKAIKDGAAKIGRLLPDLEREAIEWISAQTVRTEFELSMEFQPGDIQWLNNHTMLHAREAFVDHADRSARRLLYRLWLNHAKARPLDDAFANKVLMGPRKGVKMRAPTYVAPAAAAE